MSIGLVLSDVLRLSCFNILAGNCIFGPKFDVLGAKGGQFCKLNILMCDALKFVKWSDLYACLGKK